MAAQFIEANPNHPAMRLAIRGCQLLREAESSINAALAAFAAMKDGDGTQAAHFALLAAECEVKQNGYASAEAAAKVLFDESNSVAGNAAAGIAAAKQLCGYLGV